MGKPLRKNSPWVREWERGDEFIDHYRGVRWCDAPLPKEAHRCLAQTRAVVVVMGLPPMPIARCACGAVDIGNGWEDRNCRAGQVEANRLRTRARRVTLDHG